MAEMRAKLTINPKAGRIKRTLPPMLRISFALVKARLKEMFTPRENVEDITKIVSDECKLASIQLDVELTRYPKHAIEIAKDAKSTYDLLIVAGGDGTVNEVINGIAHSRIPLAIIPFGTSNVLALELGIPSSPKRAAKLIANGVRTQVDLGLVEAKEWSRFFATDLTVGFDVSLLKDATSKFRDRWGFLAEPIMGINLISCRWQEMRVEHETNSIGYFVMVANTKFFGGYYQMAKAANIQDGFLDLIVINRKWWRIIPLIFYVSIGADVKFQPGEYYRMKEAKVYGKPDLLVQVDGEVVGRTPIEVKVAPNALNIIVKKASQPRA